MLATFRSHLLLAGLTLFLCGVVFPSILLGIGAWIFPRQTSGGMIEGSDGKPLGSSLIAQDFSGEAWFQPRPSAVGFNASASGGSNWGANNPRLRDRVAQFLGPVVTYRKGSISEGPDPAHPRTPQKDLEAWFVADPNRVAQWAAESTIAAPNWAKTDFADDQYGLPGQFILKWCQTHPEVIDAWKKANPNAENAPKPEDLTREFFASYSKIHPATFPLVLETKGPDGGVTKQIHPGVADPLVHALFFDAWLSDPANARNVADLATVPADAVTASGSGLDPHISVANAQWQLDRVARARATGSRPMEVAKKEIAAILAKQSFAPLWGLAGEPLVNVLELNRALHQEMPLSGR